MLISLRSYSSFSSLVANVYIFGVSLCPCPDWHSLVHMYSYVVLLRKWSGMNTGQITIHSRQGLVWHCGTRQHQWLGSVVLSIFHLKKSSHSGFFSQSKPLTFHSCSAPSFYILNRLVISLTAHRLGGRVENSLYIPTITFPRFLF